MEASRILRIGLAGCGTVGSGVVRLLSQQRQAITRRTGVDIQLARILVRNPDRDRGPEVPPQILSTKAADLLAPEIDVVVELLGGCDTAREVVLSAIRAGKHVVTANKALIAQHGDVVFAEAAHRNVSVAIEATCGGGVPVVGAIQRGLVANRIDALYGIVNGTCNFVLSEMLDTRKSYADALADAQRLGYAEADPALDVSGADSAHKLAVLAALAFASPIDLRRVRAEGIERIELADLIAGYEQGYVCKLLAIAERHGKSLALEVLPAFLDRSHPLAAVRGVFNGISLYGHAVGHTHYYGRGAGAGPTASAVLADIVDVAVGTAPRLPYPIPATGATAEGTSYQPLDELEARYYIRFQVQDRPGVLAEIARVFAEQRISLSALTQRDPHDETGRQIVPLVVTTHRARVGDIRAALGRMERIEAVARPPVAIRIVDTPEEA